MKIALYTFPAGHRWAGHVTTAACVSGTPEGDAADAVCPAITGGWVETQAAVAALEGAGHQVTVETREP